MGPFWTERTPLHDLSRTMLWGLSNLSMGESRLRMRAATQPLKVLGSDRVYGLL